MRWIMIGLLLWGTSLSAQTVDSTYDTFEERYAYYIEDGPVILRDGLELWVTANVRPVAGDGRSYRCVPKLELRYRGDPPYGTTMIGTLRYSANQVMIPEYDYQGRDGTFSFAVNAPLILDMWGQPEGKLKLDELVGLPPRVGVFTVPALEPFVHAVLYRALQTESLNPHAPCGFTSDYVLDLLRGPPEGASKAECTSPFGCYE